MAMINNLSSPSIRGETDLFRLPNTGNAKQLYYDRRTK